MITYKQIKVQKKVWQLDLYENVCDNHTIFARSARIRLTVARDIFPGVEGHFSNMKGAT